MMEIIISVLMQNIYIVQGKNSIKSFDRSPLWVPLINGRKFDQRAPSENYLKYALR